MRDARERGRLLGTYDSATQAAVWQHHLAAALAGRTQLNDRQRELVQDAMALLTPEFFAIDPSDERWQTKVDAPLRAITARAQQLFTPTLARELFLEMGPRTGSAVTTQGCRDPENPSVKDDVDESAELRTPRTRPTSDLPYCQCSTLSDWCDSSGIGLYYCRGGGCTWTHSGCGTFWRYGCTGMCAQRST